jgi:hypothetical protein
MLRKTLTLVGAFTLMLVAARVDAAKHGWTIDLKAGTSIPRSVDNWKSLDPQFDSQGGGETFLGTRAGLGVTCRTSERVSVVIEGTLHGAWTSFSWGSGYEARQIVSLQTGVSIGLGDPEP